MSDIKTCEEYVIDRIRRLETRVDTTAQQRDRYLEAWKNAEQKYTDAIKKLNDIQNLLQLKIVKANRFDDNYYIYTKYLYDRTDKKAYQRICAIFGLEYEEDEEE